MGRLVMMMRPIRTGHPDNEHNDNDNDDPKPYLVGF